jgi:hypothetical protein
MKSFFKLSLILSFALASSVVLGQESYGALEGSITDPQGAVVQNASISIRNVATNHTRSITSNAEGHFKVTAATRRV